MKDLIIKDLFFKNHQIGLSKSINYDVMINATEMGKMYGPNKRPYQWLRQKDTQLYLEAFRRSEESTARLERSTPLQAVITIEGNFSDGTRPGTWMHRRVAIRYAQWLDPDFAVWIDKKIEELLVEGFTMALQEERDKYNFLLPKASYADEVLGYSDNLYSTRQICKELGLGFGPSVLLKKLETYKIIFRVGKGWELSSPYDRYGYVKSVPTFVIDQNGKKSVVNKKRWTEDGRYFLWSLAKSNSNYYDRPWQ